MTATLDLSCSCGRQPLHDPDLELADAAAIRTWTLIHQGPGHVVTATIVADPGQPANTADPAGSMFARAAAVFRGLFLR